MKATQPKDKLVKSLPWVNDYSLNTVRFIGISEFLGAIGVIVPQITGIYVILTSIAASRLGIIIILAAFYHIGKKEFKELALNVILFMLTLAIAFYRF